MACETDICKSCQTPLAGRYCYQCGQRKIDERLTLKYLLQATANILTNLERGLWFTIKELYLRPGKVIRDYLAGATIRYYHPLRYIFLMTGIAAIAVSVIDITSLIESSKIVTEDMMKPEAKETQQKTIEIVLRYPSLFYLVTLPLYSFSS
jgi:hypothetical protein